MIREKFFFPHVDSKVHAWSSALKNDLIIAVEGNPILHFLKVPILCMKNRCRPVFYFRYTNDYQNIWLQIIRIISDILLTLICYGLGGHIRWIVHNIDRDSNVNFPTLNHLRRKFIGTVSRYIYVTDPMLVDIGKRYFIATKIRYTTFGLVEKKGTSDFTENLKSKISEVKVKNPNIRIGLCATAVSEKCNHLFNLESVLDKLNYRENKVVVCLVADFRSSERALFSDLLARLSSRDDVILFPEGGIVQEKKLSNIVDFVYRSLDDISVPYSLYTSCSAKIPILTHNIGFCGDLVSQTKIGYVISRIENFDFETLDNFLFNWNSEYSKLFLTERNWELGASLLIKN